MLSKNLVKSERNTIVVEGGDVEGRFFFFLCEKLAYLTIEALEKLGGRLDMLKRHRK